MKLYYAHVAGMFDDEKIEIKEYETVEREKTYLVTDETGYERAISKLAIGRVDPKKFCTGWGTSADEALAVFRASAEAKARFHERQAMLLRDRVVLPATLVGVDGYEREIYKALSATTRDEMKKLCDGDIFVIDGKLHFAHGDSHLSGDSAYDEYIVFDSFGEGFLETDFPA